MPGTEMGAMIPGLPEASPRIKKMEDELRLKTARSIYYLPLLEEDRKLGVLGQYRYDHERGHLIFLRSEDPKFTEYTVAHELAHGLMKANGYVSAGTSEQNKELLLAAALIRATVLHPAMSSYLLSFGYLEDHRSLYFTQVEFWLEKYKEIRKHDSASGWDLGFMALKFLEALLIVPECKSRLEGFIATGAPNIWNLTHRWYGKLGKSPLDSPTNCRRATVILLKEFDIHLLQSGIKKNLISCMDVPGILQNSEREKPAFSVFRLDITQEAGTIQGLLRYLGDNSVVARLVFRDPIDVQESLRELGKLTASGLLNWLEEGESNSSKESKKGSLQGE